MLKNYSKVKVDEYGNKRYLNDEGKHHRLDGPAIEYSYGIKYWLINGNNHRNIDPSDEWQHELKRWWFKGKPHRIGGSYSSYIELWRIHNEDYTKQEYFDKVWEI